MRLASCQTTDPTSAASLSGDHCRTASRQWVFGARVRRVSRTCRLQTNRYHKANPILHCFNVPAALIVNCVSVLPATCKLAPVVRSVNSLDVVEFRTLNIQLQTQTLQQSMECLYQLQGTDCIDMAQRATRWATSHQGTCISVH